MRKIKKIQNEQKTHGGKFCHEDLNLQSNEIGKTFEINMNNKMEIVTSSCVNHFHHFRFD